MITVSELYNLDETIAAELLSGVEYPWEALPRIHDFIIELGNSLSEDVFEKRGEHIWVAKSAKVAPTACLNGPLIVDEDAEIRHCAFIRGNAIVGKGAVVGNSTELKNVILFNNEIYGLTKGQYSPTSKLGKITKTSPYGTVEKPFTPGELVIGAKGTFFARSIDAEVNLTKECLVEAAKHQGMSVTECLQNCVIFNDKTHAAFAADKATRAEHTITLRHGQKMTFGANNEKGLVFENMKLKVVTIGEDGYTLDQVLTHDAHEKDTTLHTMLAAMKYPDYPVALGVIRCVEDDTVYDQAVERQVEEVKAKSKIHSVDDLLRSGETWEVE